MHLFSCGRCGQRLYFENVSCTSCGATLGFLPGRRELVALDDAGDGLWRPMGEEALHRMCANYVEHAACNWMVPADDEHAYCPACRLNHTIPDLAVDGNIELWRAMEAEKRRLVYSLMRLNVPMAPRGDEAGGLRFDFLADAAESGGSGKVITGHADGLVTINIQEADPAERERMRGQMDEPYRTLLGHFRHESGHYVWDRLVRDTPWLPECRALFGDDTLDYGEALDRHYQQGTPADWADRFISSYATMHPWEDWAETWAHYLHIVDTLETAWQFGLRSEPSTGDDVSGVVRHNFDPYREPRIETLIDHWLPLAFALNSLNRSMGHEDAYPFVISPAVVEKLGFINRVVQAGPDSARC